MCGAYPPVGGRQPGGGPGWGTVGTVNVSGLAGRGEGLRRSHDETAGAKPGASPVDRTTVNVGTIDAPLPSWRIGALPAEGCGWGGAAVVLRGRESRPHGEGRQREEQEVTVMSEDASVNTGAVAWPSYGQAYVAVRRMQNKLHCWAAADRGRRFDDLYNLVCDPTVLTMAWERVAGNTGARTAGIDRATVAWIVSRFGVETFLHEVREQLRSRTFTPAPVRQVMIPKASGKLRALGIPTVTDRVVQAALKLVLEPIFEADFQPVSYGFRPNRRAQDAIAEIHHFTTQVVSVGAGGRHRGVFRQHRSRRVDGPAPRTDRRQARAGVGEGVPQGRGPDHHRHPGRQHHRHPAGRDPLPAAGQHRLVRAG